MDVLECNVMHLDIPALNFDTQMKSLTLDHIKPAAKFLSVSSVKSSIG